MKIQIIPVFLILVVTITLTGCMTNAVATRGAGTHKEYVRDDSVEGNYRTIEYPPQPLYFALIPFTLPLDIVTAPFQLVWQGIKVGTHTQ